MVRLPVSGRFEVSTSNEGGSEKSLPQWFLKALLDSSEALLESSELRVSCILIQAALDDAPENVAFAHIAFIGSLFDFVGYIGRETHRFRSLFRHLFAYENAASIRKRGMMI
jgi:hypothetical protein